MTGHTIHKIFRACF